jgi:membrane protease YdiL (CAAX protease family)
MEYTVIKQSTNWLSVITYYIIACLISWPFFWWRDIESESWALWNVSGFVKTGSYMWGPGIAAIICFFLFRKTHTRTVTFFGTSIIKSLLFWFVPIIALSISSLHGTEALALPIIGFILILGEELGWRGFLQDALKNVSPIKRAIIIGVLWELWHFTNRMSGGIQISTFIRVGIFIIALSIISFALIKLTDKTKSLVIAVTVHSWINILFEYSSPTTFIVFGLSLPFWAYLIWTWEKPLQLRNRK